MNKNNTAAFHWDRELVTRSNVPQIGRKLENTSRERYEASPVHKWEIKTATLVTKRYYF